MSCGDDGQPGVVSNVRSGLTLHAPSGRAPGGRQIVTELAKTRLSISKPEISSRLTDQYADRLSDNIVILMFSDLCLREMQLSP